MRRSTSTVAALVDEALTGLWRARSMTGLSVALIAVSIFLVGVFFLVAENLKSVVEAVRDETAVTVFLKSGTTGADRLGIESTARESGLVEHLRRVSSEDARRRFAASSRSLAAAAATLATSPFPESIELDLIPVATSSKALPGLLANLARQPGVEEVQFDLEWIRRLRGVVAVVRTGGVAVGFILAFGAAFTITNVVRLTILLHRDEIEILRMVGAPELLIRGPFLLGGMTQGLLGGLVGLGALALGFHALLRFVAMTHNVLLGVFVVRFLDPGAAAALVSFGVLAGVLGGAVAVRNRNLEPSG